LMGGGKKRGGSSDSQAAIEKEGKVSVGRPSRKEHAERGHYFRKEVKGKKNRSARPPRKENPFLLI